MSDSGVAQRIGEFFRTRTTTVGLQPKVQIDYSTYNDEQLDILRTQWEALLVEMDASKVIVNREMNDFGSGYKYEEVTARIDGVLIHLKGPHYPSTKTQQQYAHEYNPQTEADNRLSTIMSQYDIVKTLEVASRPKAETFYNVIAAAMGKRGTDPEVIREVTDNVLRVLQIKSLTERSRE